MNTLNVSSSSPSSTDGVFSRMERIACVAHAFWIICPRVGVGVGVGVGVAVPPRR